MSTAWWTYTITSSYRYCAGSNMIWQSVPADQLINSSTVYLGLNTRSVQIYIHRVFRTYNPILLFDFCQRWRWLGSLVRCCADIIWFYRCVEENGITKRTKFNILFVISWSIWPAMCFQWLPHILQAIDDHQMVHVWCIAIYYKNMWIRVGNHKV